MTRPQRTPVPATDAAAGRVVTSYDVARLAGVSQSAVSRCYKPGASVSAKTRASVMKAADTLGYRPNAIARMLFTKRSNLVAVVVTNLGSNPDFASTLSRLTARRDLNILFFTLDHEDEADRVVERLWQYRVDGVLAAATLSSRHIDVLRERDVPLIFLNRRAGDSDVNSVCCDQAAGERMLVDRLIASGHQRFAIIAGPDDSTVSDQRVAAATERLAAAGLPAPRIVVADFSYEGGRQAVRELCVGAAPDAVICANDMMAIGCIDEARHGLGLRIPHDVSVVGFDGLAPGRWLGYDLTTIRQPTEAMVSAALDMLVARIDDPALGAERRTLSGEFVPGGSARLS